MKNNSKSLLRILFTVCALIVCCFVMSAQACASDQWTRIDDSDEVSVLYSSKWGEVRETGLYEGKSHQTNETGETVSFTFEGTGVRWIGQKDTNYTCAKVYLDDRLVEIPNARGSAAKQQVIYSLIGIPSGEHTLKIESLGPPVAHDQNYIEVDAFEYSNSSDWSLDGDKLSITLLQDTLAVGEEIRAAVSMQKNMDLLNAIYFPLSELTFQVQDDSIASVGEDGTVRALKAGKTIITASVGKLQASVNITIVNEYGTAEPRKVINSENPVLMVPLYAANANSDVMENGDTLLGRWEMIPVDLRENAVMQLHPGSIRGADNIKRFYSRQLDIAKENQIPVALVVITGADKKGLDASWAEEVLKNYDNLVALVTAEDYSAWEYLLPQVVSYLNAAAKYGAYVMCFEQWENTYVKLGENAAFMEASKRLKDYLILSFKSTSSLETVATNSYIQGMWLTDICGQWGGLIDSWFWNERAYWKLFGPPLGDWHSWGDVISYYGGEEARSAVTEPEAMIGMQMMNIYLNGGCVYNFEHPNYINGIKNMTTPLFDNVIVPAFRHFLENPAPTKEEIQSGVKAVYSGKISEIPDYYTGLISEDVRSPLYSSGRYGILPALPSTFSKESIQEHMPKAVILTKNSPELSNQAEKTAFFDSLYAKDYQGEGYAVNRDGIWYFYNSHDNQDIDQTITLYCKNEVTAGITMEPHTYGILSEADNLIKLSLNNFRVNKDEIWAGYQQVDKPDGTTTVIKPNDQWNDDNPQMNVWIENTYMKLKPEDLDMRTTKIELKGLYGRPVVTVADGMEWMTEGEPEVEYDQETGSALISVKCNGRVQVEIQMASVDKTQLSEALNEAARIEEEISNGVYRSAGQETFRQCLEAARKIMLETECTEKSVEEAVGALHAAISALRQKSYVSDLKISKTEDQIYCANAVVPEVTVKEGTYTLKEGVDYRAEYHNNVQAGTAEIVIRGIGEYRGTTKVSFQILTFSIDKCPVASIANQTYTGKAKKPEVRLTFNREPLALGRDYTVSYKNNKNTGRAVIVVKGTGNFSGERRVYFNIAPKKVFLKKVQSLGSGKIMLIWNRDKRASGYQITCAGDKSFKGKKRNIILVGGKITKAKIVKLKKGKKYYVKIRSYKLIQGKKVFGAYSRRVLVRVK